MVSRDGKRCGCPAEAGQAGRCAVSRGLFLTVTLSTSRLDDWRQFAPTFLNSEFNRVLKELQPDKDAKRSLERDLERVSDIIKHDVASQTQGLALFADGGPELFERIELPLPLLNRVVIEPSPHVRPLVHALALMEPFVLARVSRDESSLYVVDEWGLAREQELTGPWLKWSDQETGELAVRRYFAAARQDALVEQHFKEVGTSLGKLLDVSGTRRVVLCAQHDIASNFRHTLPQATAAHIVAQIPFDAVATVEADARSRPDGLSGGPAPGVGGPGASHQGQRRQCRPRGRGFR